MTKSRNMLERPRMDGTEGGAVPWGPLAPSEVASIQTRADCILECIGVEVRDHPETLERFRAAGASVSGNRVRFEGGLARAIAREKLRDSFVQRARNSLRDVVFGDGGVITAPVASAPMVRGRDGRRRYGTQTDHEDFARLAQQLSAINHAGGGYCELTDRGAASRHLHALASVLRITDKPVMGTARAPNEVEDSLDMVRIVFGTERLSRECCLVNLFNVESPLVMTAGTLEGIRLTVEAGQGAIVTSYAILGMNAPVTIVDALPLMLAEVEAGVALTQLFSPGSPVIAGWYGVPFSMSSMRPAFGAIEGMMVMAAGAQLIRALGCPVRGDGAVTSAKVTDAQAGSDSARGLDFTRIAGIDLGLHAAGWLESGLVASREKFVLDAAVIDSLSGDRQDRCTLKGGGRWDRDWRALLDEYEPPPISDGIAADLDRFVAERARADAHDPCTKR